MGQSNPEDLGNGGTIDGDIIITGDLQVDGGGSLSFDEIIEGTQVIDVTSTEALLVRKNGDGGDIFIVDTTNSRVGIGTTPSVQLHLSSSDNQKIRLQKSSNYTDLEMGTSDFYIGLGGSRKVAVLSGGNVGIGTQSPSVLLNLESATSTAITAENTGNSAVALNLDANRSGADQGLGNINFKWNGTAVAQISGASGADTTNKDDGQIQFSTMSGGSSSVNMTLDKDGKLGLGISPVFNSLHIHKPNSDYNYIHITNTTTGTTHDDGLLFGFESDEHAYIVNRENTNLNFFTNNTQRMQISAGGNLGIGTVSPSAKIHSTGTILIDESAGTSNSAVLRLEANRGSADQDSGEIRFYNQGGSDHDYARIVGVRGGVTNSGYLQFRTSEAGSEGTRMTISSTGNIGIGVTPSVTASAYDSLQIGGNANITSYGTQGAGGQVDYGHNFYYAPSGQDKYISEDEATQFRQGSGNFVFRTAPSGTADSAITFTERMKITQAGQVLIGGATDLGFAPNLIVEGTQPCLALIKDADAFFNINVEEDHASIFYDHAKKLEIGHAVNSGGTTFTTNMILDANSRISLSNNDSGTSNTVFGYSAGASLQSGGDKNLIIGHEAGDAITTGDFNSVLGYQSGTDLTTGERNVFLGYGTGVDVTEATHNTAIGMGALGSVTNHVVGTVALGYNALPNSGLTTGANYTVAIGYSALQSLTSGANNVAIGYQSMAETTGGNYNTAIGYQAMYRDAGLANIHNTFVGQGIASGDWTTGASTHNTGMGSGVMQGAMNGALGNTAIGVDSLNALTSGDYNTALGFNAGASINSGGYNVFVGYNAGDAVNTAAGNVFLGASAGSACTDTANAVLIGNGAGEDSDIASDGIIAIGYQALKALTSGAETLQALTTGSGNQAFGAYSGYNITTGSNNIFIGTDAGFAITDVADTVLIGSQAGDAINNTGANGTVAIGKDSLTALTSGAENTAVGYQTGLNNASGGYNSYFGYKAGYGGSGNESFNTGVGRNSLVAITSGAQNTAIGNNSGEAITSGGINTTLGDNAGDTLATGSYNTIVGGSADVSASGSANQTVLGYGATSQGDNSVTLGNASVTDVYMAQDSGAYVHSQNVPNHVANTMSSPYYRFDGGNDEITVADNANLTFGNGTTDNGFSISAWIHMEDATHFSIATKNDTGLGEYRFLTDGDDKLQFLLSDASSSGYEYAYTSAITAYENQWIHVVATYNGVGGTSANAGITLYINGVSQSVTLADSGSYTAMENTAHEFRIGNLHNSNYARGSIACLRVWNKELTTSEIKDDYSGASVAYKYKGANQTDINASFDFTSGWSASTGASVVDSNSFSVSASNGQGIYKTLLTIGKSYRLVLAGTMPANMVMSVRNSAGGANEIGSGFGTYEFTATDTSIYLRVSGATGQIDVSAFTIVPIGAVAEYDGSSAGSKVWGDKSGNGLHGTVGAGTLDATAPTLENTPYDSGTEYEAGTFTPVWVAGTGTLGSINYTNQTGKYVKIGNSVTITISFYNGSFADGGASGNLKLSGLPFTAGDKYALSFGDTRLFGGDTPSEAQTDTGATTITLFYRDASDGANAVLQVSDAATGSGALNLVTISGTYLV